MQEITKICPKCNGEMEKGVVVDYAHGAVKISSWAKNVSMTLGLIPNIEGKMPITSYKCKNCGYIENYAG